MNEFLIPPPLRKGDGIAIVSPATVVKEEYIRGAADFLSGKGYDVVIMPSASGPAQGSYAASLENRLSDLKTALHDDHVKCILCARGGYGCVHLLPFLNPEEIRENPKWIAGFSDVSALLALWMKAGVASIHSPMAKHLTLFPEDASTDFLLDILSGAPSIRYNIANHPFNSFGEASGKLAGGNLAVLNGLAATSYDILKIDPEEKIILFIEDISEAIYAVERMLVRLNLSGTLHRLSGLIIGKFTEYRPDKNFHSMEDMIHSLLLRCGVKGIPVVFDFPVGHVDYNLPLVEGAETGLTVNAEGVTLSQNLYHHEYHN